MTRQLRQTLQKLQAAGRTTTGANGISQVNPSDSTARCAAPERQHLWRLAKACRASRYSPGIFFLHAVDFDHRSAPRWRRLKQQIKRAQHPLQSDIEASHKMFVYWDTLCFQVTRWTLTEFDTLSGWDQTVHAPMGCLPLLAHFIHSMNLHIYIWFQMSGVLNGADAQTNDYCRLFAHHTLSTAVEKSGHNTIGR